MKIQYIILGLILTLPAYAAGFFASPELAEEQRQFQKMQEKQKMQFEDHQVNLQTDILRDRIWREERKITPNSDKIYKLNKQIEQLKEIK